MQAVIMAGGKGTRLKELTAEIPKPMIPICGKPVLQHQIENLKSSGVNRFIIIVGHLGEKIIEYFGDGEKFGVEIDYYTEKEPLGTGGALHYVLNKLDQDFILLYGDVFMDVSFDRMIKFHVDNKAIATLLVHPNSHPYDSDIIVEKDNRVIAWDHKSNNRNYDYNNLVNSGIYIFSKEAAKGLDGQARDLEKDILKNLIENNSDVYTYKSTEYVKDMGTPDRLISVESDFKMGITSQRNLRNLQKCIFLDRDGTINIEVGHLNHPDEIQLIEGTAEAIKLINNSEYICIVITNQPVIARGEASFEDMDNIHRRLETILGNEGVYIDDIIFCPHHPHSGYDGEVKDLKIDCDCRKPKPGMLLNAREKYNIDFSKSYIVGDSTVDIELGRRLEMGAILVKTGASGLDAKHEISPLYTAENLLGAVKYIIKNER